jgi:hypothetical protein
MLTHSKSNWVFQRKSQAFVASVPRMSPLPSIAAAVSSHARLPPYRKRSSAIDPARREPVSRRANA